MLEDPAPAVELTGMSEAFVEVTVRAWVEAGDFGAVKADMMLAGRLLADGSEQLPALPAPRAKPAPPKKKPRPTLSDRLRAKP